MRDWFSPHGRGYVTWRYSCLDITSLKHDPVLCPKETPEPHNEENVGFLPHCLKMVFALSYHCVLVC
jgi:hypothetical protein